MDAFLAVTENMAISQSNKSLVKDLNEQLKSTKDELNILELNEARSFEDLKELNMSTAQYTSKTQDEQAKERPRSEVKFSFGRTNRQRKDKLAGKKRK